MPEENDTTSESELTPDEEDAFRDCTDQSGDELEEFCIRITEHNGDADLEGGYNEGHGKEPKKRKKRKKTDPADLVHHCESCEKSYKTARTLDIHRKKYFCYILFFFTP